MWKSHRKSHVVSKGLCPNILKLPGDILHKIRMYLGEKQYMFLYVILSTKESDESKMFLPAARAAAEAGGRKASSVKWVNNVYNSITYVRLFEENLWGSGRIPTTEEFQKMFNPYFSDNVSEKRLENNFEILKDIAEYLDESPNKSFIDIIWKRRRIGTKKRHTKYVVPNRFWDMSLKNLKGGIYNVCGCTPSCWRCRKKCDVFNVQHGDKLLVKSKENGKYYRCSIKIIKFEDKYYTSVRDIYMEFCEHGMVWWDNFVSQIQIFMELLPLPHESVLKHLTQVVSGNEDIFYMASCYTALLAWGPKQLPRKMMMHKVYNIPPGWVYVAKREAKTALSLVY